MKPERYAEIMEDRPSKASPEEVEYREAEDVMNRCKTCVHFYERTVDRYGVCEIMRPPDDKAVNPNYVCEWWNDGDGDFPLYTPKR